MVLIVCLCFVICIRMFCGFGVGVFMFYLIVGCCLLICLWVLILVPCFWLFYAISLLCLGGGFCLGILFADGVGLLFDLL